MYQDKHEYNVIKGVIPDFGYDVKFAIKVDGEKQNEIPESQAKGSNGKFYKVEVNCDNNVDGEWDYNAWNVKLNGVVENSKCTLSFVSNMDATERDNLLKAGVTYRRNTYRGKDITSYWNGTETVNGRNLYEQISNCTFDDIYVGDYIKGSNNITWLIADLNNYLNTGATQGDFSSHLTQCHATIIPDGYIARSRINPTASMGVANTVTEGMIGYGLEAYLGSEMKNITLPNVLEKYVEPDFKDHIIEYPIILSSKINNSASSAVALSTTGISIGSKWVNSKIDLMSEPNVFGTTIWSNGHDVGIDTSQYAIFRLRQELISNDTKGNYISYALRTIASSKIIVSVGFGGIAHASQGWQANELHSIRPRFLIG